MKSFVAESNSKYIQSINLPAGQYTFSAIVQSPNNMWYSFAIKEIGGWKTFDLNLHTNEFKKVSVQFKTDGVTEFNLVSNYASSSNVIKVISPMLEGGTIASTPKRHVLDFTEEMQIVWREIGEVSQSISNLQTNFTDFASDGVINIAEAKAIEKYINLLNVEKSDIDNQYNKIYNDVLLTDPAKTYLSGSKASYDIAHLNLSGSISSSISDGKTTAKEKSDVDSNFTVYKEKLGELTISFRDAITAIDKARIDNVQIGGRNLIKNSANWVNLNSWASNGSEMSIVTIDGVPCLRLVGQNGAGQDIGKQLKPNTEYTFSAYMRSDLELGGGVDNQLHIQVWRDEDTSNIHQDISVSADTSLPANVWKLVTYTFRTPSSSGLCYCRLFFYPLSTGTVDIRYCKLEQGNKATDWTPAPEDVEAEILAVSNQAQTALSKASTAQSTADGKIKSFYQDEAPSVASEGDIWFDTNNGNKVHTYRSGSWVDTQDSDIAKAINSAQTAKTTADGKANVYYQTSAPTGMTESDTGDIWIDTDDNNKMWIYSGTDWVVAQDYYAAIKKVDDLQIGGRNLLLNSYEIVTPNYAADGDNNTYFDDRTCDLIAGETYIVKGVCPSGLNWSKIHGDVSSINAVLWLRGENDSHQIISSDTTGTTGTIFTVSVSQRYTLRTNVYKAGKYTFSKIKIEKGNKATDWTPAPEDEAQKVINLENKTNFLGTTSEGNIVATGTLLVGNSDGTNAGITGIGDTSNGVYLWGGGTYQQMLQGKAKKEQRRDGIDIWRHPNGQIGFEIGIKDGRLIFNGYHSNGYKLFELDPNRGLIAVSYTQESWTQTPLRKLDYTSSTFNESTIASEITSAIDKKQTRTYFRGGRYDVTPPDQTYVDNPNSNPNQNTVGTEYVVTTTYTLLENYLGYEYDNGTNPTNSEYESSKGMKANNGDRNTNIPNGWYMSSIGEIYSESEWNNPPQPTYTFTVYVYYYQDGKVTQTQVVTITK